jgi:hypothetical protein
VWLTGPAPAPPVTAVAGGRVPGGWLADGHVARGRVVGGHVARGRVVG